MAGGRRGGDGDGAGGPLELWWCRRLPAPALISVAQCERNAERADRAHGKRPMGSSGFVSERRTEAACTLVHLGACVGCPGVLALARRRGQEGPDRVMERGRAAPAPAAGKKRGRRGFSMAERVARRWRDR